MPTTAAPSDYLIGGVVGHGCVGLLREGTAVATDQLVVLEQLPRELAADSDFVRRTEVVAEMASAIVSPYLVRTLGVVRDGDAIYVVSEDVAGSSLAAVLTNGKVDVATAGAITVDVLRGLATLHEGFLGYGDVSPAAVLVGTLGEVKLRGVAVAAARSHGSQRSDIESVTVLFNELVDGQTLPSALAEVIERARRTSEDGFADADAYAGSLEEALAMEFGKAWRNSKELGKRAIAVPKGAPAMDLATNVAGRRSTADPAAVTSPAAQKQSGAAVATPHRPHRGRYIGIAVILVLATAAIAGVAVLRHVSSKPLVPALGGAPAALALNGAPQLALTPAQGGCNTVFLFSATVNTKGSGTLAYQWQEDGAPLGDIATMPVSKDGAITLHQAIKMQGTRTFSTSVAFHILSPSDTTVSRTLSYSCA